MPKDFVLPHLNAHARGGSILDLGCGPGAIGEAIDPTTYRHYLGVDISDVAIEKARGKNSRLNNIYALGDMWTFNPPGTYDLIFFGDSLYNFSFPNGKKILARYSSYLNEGGVFVIRTWVSVDRSRAIIKLIESDYDVIEKRSYAPRRPNPMVVIVFKLKGLQ
jgi:SAM-dependent methyltransferase